MSVPYYVHAGARLRRILRQKQIVILHYAKKTGLTPQGLYRYFSLASIKREKLDILLEAIPLTLEDFCNWNSLEGNSWHHGELLQLYLAKQKIKDKQLAALLQLSMSEVHEWLDSAVFSTVQLEQLHHQLGLSPSYFMGPQSIKQEVNWAEAYLDKCMEVQQYIRKVNTLEKRINVLEAR
ncbi:helix-turn-helix transcriptional regulator [Chitinophaga sp.]|uniref:helix-turn-helix domain-containing protein n=1 Tax=Chitinophaga sp. TaxID=1869181 RepID=UPI002F95ABCE